MSSDLTNEQLFDLMTLGMLWRDQAAEKILRHNGGSVLRTLTVANIITEARRKTLIAKDWKFLGDFVSTRCDTAKIGLHSRRISDPVREEAKKPILLVMPINATLNYINIFGAGETAYRLVLTAVGVEQAMHSEGVYRHLLTPATYMAAWASYLSQIRAHRMRVKNTGAGSSVVIDSSRTVRAVPEEDWEW